MEETQTYFQKVYEIVAQIPAGEVASYGQIARFIGMPRTARQVGWAMRRAPDNLPWQRVVKADGTVTGAGIYAEIRRSLLESEGVQFLPDGRVDMAKCQWCRGSELLKTP